MVIVRKLGKWPSNGKGIIEGTTRTWAAVDMCLKNGRLGLPKGLSISMILELHRDYIPRNKRPNLTVDQISDWLCKHHKKYGTWPTNKSSGCVLDGETTWGAVERALRVGGRGLPGGSSLSKLRKSLH